jgi:predicted house-cleaning NTP pyrophosphatase (Maf/HAM1 superfamily)
MERRSTLQAKILILKDQILTKIEDTYKAIESLKDAQDQADEIASAIGLVALTCIIYHESNRSVINMANDLKDAAEELEGLRNG